MATINNFEELEIWQLARIQANDFLEILKNPLLAKDYKLRNQMNASSGLVIDNIAKGFERSGTSGATTSNIKLQTNP
ncbi:hypothetical protein BH09BAC2_BH09BAC2_22920 [soil metagenome]